MKLNYLYFASLVALSGACSTYTLDSASDLPSCQESFQDVYRQLDELTQIIQYIVQVVQHDGIHVLSKKALRDWAYMIQKTIKEIRRTDDPSKELALLSMVGSTRALIYHIHDALETNFSNLTEFEPPVLVCDETGPSYRTHKSRCERMLNENDEQICALREQAQVAGLTKINLLARKLDRINDKYHITGLLSKLPYLLAAGYIGAFLTPKTWLNKHLPFLNRVKDLVGEPDYYKKRVKGPDQPDEPFVISKFLQSEYKEFEHLIISGWALSHVSFAPLTSYIRDWWNKLKGYEHKDSAGFRYAEITLDDPRIIGLETQVEEMRNIVRYITEPEIYDRTNSGLEKGVLLEGPSRTGKTLLAQALCGTINQELRERGILRKFAFREIKWSEIKHNVEGIKTVIREAKEHAPCILFLDELHNYSLQVSQHGETLNEFLTMAESLNSNDIGDTVIILAATNRSYMLDDALLKPGRFGKVIHFELPTAHTRKQFFIEMFKTNGLDPDTTGISIDDLSRQTEGASYGDLDHIFKNARFTASSQYRSVAQEDFQEHIYRQLYRLQDARAVKLTPTEKKVVAAHQAGHALMHILFEDSLQERLELATIRGRWSKIVETRFFDAKLNEVHAKKKVTYGHIITSHKSESIALASDPILACKVRLAGAVAEKILLGTSSSYHQNYRHKAFLRYLNEGLLKGLEKEDLAPEDLRKEQSQAKQDLEQFEKETAKLLGQHKEELSIIAAELENGGVLTGEVIKALVQQSQERSASHT